MDPQAAKYIGAGLSMIALLGVGIVIVLVALASIVRGPRRTARA